MSSLSPAFANGLFTMRVHRLEDPALCYLILTDSAGVSHPLCCRTLDLLPLFGSLYRQAKVAAARLHAEPPMHTGNSRNEARREAKYNAKRRPSVVK